MLGGAYCIQNRSSVTIVLMARSLFFSSSFWLLGNYRKHFLEELGRGYWMGARCFWKKQKKICRIHGRKTSRCCLKRWFYSCVNKLVLEQPKSPHRGNISKCVLKTFRENTNSPRRIYTSRHTTKTLLSNALETNSYKLWIKAVERLGTKQTQA